MSNALFETCKREKQSARVASGKALYFFVANFGNTNVASVATLACTVTHHSAGQFLP